MCIPLDWERVISGPIFALAAGLTLYRLGVGLSTVERTRKRFVEGGLEHALTDLPRPGKARKVDGKQEALLVALACSDPPEGRERWTMQLLAGRLVELGVVDSISDETVRVMLKKTT